MKQVKVKYKGRKAGKKMECCGRERTTAFCSDCGSKLAVSAKHEVIVFLIGKRNVLVGTLERQEKWALANPEAAQTSRYHRLKGPRLRLKIERFNGWINSLDKLIDPEAGDESDNQ